MKKRSLLIMMLAIHCMVITNSCAQDDPMLSNSDQNVFVGSTPCDSFIKSSLMIPLNAKCDFIKWELKLNRLNTGNQFNLTVVYGEAKPNTNGFMNDNKISVTDKFAISQGSETNPRGKVYQLRSNSFSWPLILVEMDNNILHFADDKKNLLVGNGGWGYVLNRINK